MSSDYSHLKIDGYETINGVAVPYYEGESSPLGTPCRHYLDWNDVQDGEARQLTSPTAASHMWWGLATTSTASTTPGYPTVA